MMEYWSDGVLEWWSNWVMGVWARRRVGPKGLGTWPTLLPGFARFNEAPGLKDSLKRETCGRLGFRHCEIGAP
jgi:hypothetical protein